MKGRPRPTYDLAKIKQLVRDGRWTPEGPALRGLASLGMDSEDVVECVQALTRADFYKTMPSECREGMFHDVYKPVFDGWRLYVKLQLTGGEDEDDTEAVVIQFKAAD